MIILKGLLAVLSTVHWLRQKLVETIHPAKNDVIFRRLLLLNKVHILELGIHLLPIFFTANLVFFLKSILQLTLQIMY